MSKRIDFPTTAELLKYLHSAFSRSAWCDIFDPEILSEGKRPAFSRMVSACANAGGGNFFFGGKAKGKHFLEIHPVNVSDSQYLEHQISQNVFPEIPGLTVRFFPMENSKESGIIHLYIPDSPRKPFMASDFRYYMRTGLREQVMEEYQVRTLYKATACAEMELAGIINTNGIPEYSEGVLTEVRFYPKFLIRNNGNAPTGVYKFELYIPSDLHDTSFTALQNYFNRLDGVHTVFSFPSRSTVFQGETMAVAEAKISVTPENIASYSKNELKIILYSGEGVQHYDFKLSETFTVDNRPVSEEVFSVSKIRIIQSK